MTERWLPVPGYEGLYEVSDQGRFRSIRRKGAKGGLIREQPGKWGTVIRLQRAGHQRTHQVYRLVLEAFVGLRPPGQWCRHLNGNSADNRLDNILWDTPENNIRDQILHGTNREANKTRCPRGHRLASPNLVRSATYRQCRSCKAGFDKLRRDRTASVTEYADAFYARLGMN